MNDKIDQSLYIAAEEAAEILNISVASLYSYVSRGLVKSQSVAGSRRKGYLRSDIVALNNKQLGINNDSNFYFAPDLSTDTITSVADSGPVYRGVHACDLARTESLESVAALLWECSSDAFNTAPAPIVPPDLPALKTRLKDLSLLKQFVSLVPLLEQTNPRSYNLSADGVISTGASVVRGLASWVAHCDEHPVGVPIHQFIVERSDLGQGYGQLLRALLVLAADHGQGPASLAAKNSAYAGNTPYGVVASALITWQGVFMQRGLVLPLNRFLTEIMTTRKPDSVIISWLQGASQLPGFDHPIYGAQDPRGLLLMTLIKEYLPDDRDALTFCRAVEVAHELTAKSPSMNLISTFLAYKLRLPDQMHALIAVGRSVGWLAHAREFYKSNRPVPYNGASPSPV